MGSFWATLFGSAFGVVAGVTVQFFVQKIIDGGRKKRIESAISKEAEYNLIILSEIRAALQDVRNAFNSNTLNSISQHIPFNRGLHIQVNNLAANGTLYEFFDKPQLANITKIADLMSVGTASWYNEEIERRKRSFIQDQENFDREEFAAFLKFADGQVEQLQNGLQSLAQDFAGRR